MECLAVIFEADFTEHVAYSFSNGWPATMASSKMAWTRWYCRGWARIFGVSLLNLRRNKLRRFLASMRCSSHLLHIVADCTADTPSGQHTAASARHPQPWSLKASSICWSQASISQPLGGKSSQFSLNWRLMHAAVVLNNKHLRHASTVCARGCLDMRMHHVHCCQCVLISKQHLSCSVLMQYKL